MQLYFNLHANRENVMPSIVSPFNIILIILQSKNESHLWSLQCSVWAAETTRRVNDQLLHLLGKRALIHCLQEGCRVN